MTYNKKLKTWFNKNRKNYIVDILNKFEGKNFNYSYNHSFTKEELLDMIFIDDKEEALLKYIEETKN